eukprot:gene15230-18023_t
MFGENCEYTYTFRFGQCCGFGSEINFYFLSALLAQYTGRTFLIDASKWSYGVYSRIFEVDTEAKTCTNFIRGDSDIVNSRLELPNADKQHQFGGRPWGGRIDYFGEIDNSVITFQEFRNLSQSLYRPSKSVGIMVDYYLESIATYNPDEPFYAIHVRRSDKIIEAEYINVVSYLRALEQRIGMLEKREVTADTAGVNLFVASDEIDKIFDNVVKLRPLWN